MKLYVVTGGSYSDYHLEEIFSTKEKAEEYIKLAREYDRFGVNEDIIECDLDPVIRLPKKHGKFTHWYYIEMDRDGNIYSNSQFGRLINTRDIDDDYFKEFKEYVEFDHYWRGNGYKVVMKAVLNADSEEHAIKKAGEIRTQFKVRGLFPETDDRGEFKHHIVNGKKYKPYSCEVIR